MAFIIHGSNTQPIGVFEPVYYKCPNCENLHTTYIVISSTYFHFFWIPAFPYEKDAVANCSECGFRRKEGKFGPQLVKEFEGKRREFKHPWWTYGLTVIVGGAIALSIIFAIFKI